MSDLADEFDARWLSIAHASLHCGHAPIFSIFGPSGSGKTTLVTALQPVAQIYREEVKDNPYLSKLLRGETFDAQANQRWFLDRMRTFLGVAKTSLPVILDQDPGAIVLVYARMFLDQGKLSLASYEALIEELISFERELRAWRTPRACVYLQAQPELLHQRVSNRSQGDQTPDLTWFAEIHSRFQRFAALVPGVTTFDSGSLSIKELTERTMRLLEAERLR